MINIEVFFFPQKGKVTNWDTASSILELQNSDLLRFFLFLFIFSGI